MLLLHEDQWYQLPNDQWCKAIAVADPIGPILLVYGFDIGGSDGYHNIFDIYVQPGGLLEATGLCTWDTWTLADLREVTPDEAETQTLRVAKLLITTNRHGSAHEAYRRLPKDYG